MMIEFHGTVNNHHVIIAKTMWQLKRLASRFANNTFNVIDEMYVTIHDVNKSANIDRFKMTRINKVCPNNTIERGSWR